MTNKTQQEISEGWYKIRFQNEYIIAYLRPENLNPLIRDIRITGFSEEFGGKFYCGWTSKEEFEIEKKFEEHGIKGVEEIIRDIRKNAKDLTRMADEILLFTATKNKDK